MFSSPPALVGPAAPTTLALPFPGDEHAPAAPSLTPAVPWVVRSLPASAQGLPPLQRALAARGLSDGAISHLTDRTARLGDPGALPEMQQAVDRLARAHTARERVAVHGDSDTDGLTSTAIMAGALRSFGFAQPLAVSIPERAGEGFGLSAAAVERLARDHVTLIVTVDTGSSSDAGLQKARALGIDVVVTDHHHVPRNAAAYTGTCALVNPAHRENQTGVGRELAGSGVAFLVASALGMALLGTQEGGRAMVPFLDLAAVGAIADMVPLTGQTRVLVRHGLAALNKPESERRRPGLWALARAGKVAPGALCAADVAFQIAPRLNAAGRYSQARLAYDLLCSQDTHTAERGAVLLEEINQRRKKDVETGLGLALAGLVGRYGSLETSVLPPALLVVGDWPHTGVQGLIAGKLAQATNRPTLVGTPASARTDAGLVLVGGSGRGTAGAPILPLLEATHALWHSYGGHGMACGFALLERDVTAAQDALSAAAARLYAPPGEPAVELDAVLHHHELTRVEAEQLARLEPTGQGNPTPLFLVEDLQVVTAKAVGSDKRTLKLELRTSGGKTIGGIAFGKGALAPLLAEGRQVDVAANLTLNTYRETTSVQLVVRDLRPAEKTA